MLVTKRLFARHYCLQEPPSHSFILCVCTFFGNAGFIPGLYRKENYANLVHSSPGLTVCTSVEQSTPKVTAPLCCSNIPFKMLVNMMKTKNRNFAKPKPNPPLKYASLSRYNRDHLSWGSFGSSCQEPIPFMHR